METRRVYFDNNATTPLHPEVKRVMADAMETFGNPSSLHAYGREARALVEEARKKVAAFIGAEPEEIMFVGSGSEGNNTVLSIVTCQGRPCSIGSFGPRNLVTTKIEHPCILEASKCLAERGFGVTFVDVDSDGKVDLDRLEDAINDRTALVSVMMANNEIGTVQDIKTIARICHDKGALFHTDAVQAVGKVRLDVKELDVDFLTLSGHKIYAPKGIGAVYVRKGAPFCPFIRGGHQERGRRAGTENTIGIAALGKAVELRDLEMDAEGERLRAMKERLKEGIAAAIPDVHFVGHPTDCLAGTLNVSFEGAEGEAILLYLDLAGIAVSTGSACASGSLDPSHVILATGLSPECAHGSIRISMGRENTMEDVDYFLDVLPGVISRIRKMSSAYAGRK
ncbi:MAG TPA: cysteine desulfurase family protein [Deltaproteobacteria bacterium]|nr:cysteine desulfurase family protein [Deltaproteobacteria bacterium]HPP79450.1 cysteine desulfurase family protein [Deltaproteobacteria bacterium]